jgi:LysM repeat protein
MTNKGSQLASRELIILASLILIAALAAGITYAVVNRPVVKVGATPVADLAATQPAVASPGATDTAPPAVQPSPSPLPTPTLTATPCLPPAGWVLYQVQPNETLFSIAARYGLTAEDLQQANCLPSVDLIRSGQGLYVPYLITPTSTPCAPPASWVRYSVQAGENLYRIALRYGMAASYLQQANCLPSASAVRTGQTIYVPYLIPSPVPPPTRPPDDDVTPLPDLKPEIFYSAGGEPPIEAKCREPKGTGSHEITFSKRGTPNLDTFELCVFGYPTRTPVTVKLYDPDNQFVAEKVFTVTQSFDTSTKLRVSLWYPVGLPTGLWYAEAEDGAAVTGIITVTPFLSATINTVPQGDVNPFDRQDCGIHTYRDGEKVHVRGAGFVDVAGQKLRLGIYRHTEIKVEEKGRKLLFVRELTVTPNGQGDFATSVIATASGSGEKEAYWIVPVTDVKQEQYVRDSSIVCFKVE